MNKRDTLKQEAQVFITQLKAEYDAKISEKELAKYTDEAKGEYKDNLSKQYYKIAEEKREIYRSLIFAAGKKEVILAEKIASEAKRIKEINSEKPDELLKQNNALLHVGFMLQNGTVIQISDLVERYRENDDIISMIAAQSNKPGYESIKSDLNKVEDHSIHHLKNSVESQDISFSEKFPHLTGLGKSPFDLFDMGRATEHNFFS